MRFLGGRFLVGLFLLLLGVVIVLNQFGLTIDAREIFSYWPVLLILLGLDWLVRSLRGPGAAKGETVFSPGQFFSGLLLILIGAFYLSRKFGYLRGLSTDVFWSLLLALLLIIAGLNLIQSRLTAAKGGGRWAFLGGINVGSRTPWRLESGSYFAFMGGIELDLTAAELSGAETVVDLTAVMGGINVKIPPGLSLIYEGTAFLGGIAFKDQEDSGIVAVRRADQSGGRAGPILRLQARAFMGGIEIKERSVPESEAAQAGP